MPSSSRLFRHGDFCSRSKCTCSSSSAAKWSASSAAGRSSFSMRLLLACRRCFSFWLAFGSACGVAGSSGSHFGIFIAFATIYPRVEMLFLRIQAKWIALILDRHRHPGRSGQPRLGRHDSCLWTTVAIASVFVRAPRHRSRARMVERFQIALAAETEIPCRSALVPEPRLRTGEYSRVDRSGFGKDLAVRESIA